MFTLLSGRPRHCLAIGERALVWGESSRTWRGRHRYRCLLSPTPSGIVKASPIELNVTDRAALEERLRSLAGPAKPFQMFGRTFLPSLPRSVTLVISDLAVRTTVIRLEQYPVKKEEQEALIRWRLGQENQLPLTGARLIWQVYPPRQATGGVYIVLVVVVQESILAQYESACEAVGLLPQEVAVASFRLFDLWLKAAGGRRRLNRDFAWVNLADEGLTCVVIHQGRPVFVRTKRLTVDEGQQDRAVSPEWIQKVVHETAVSLMACREQYPDLQVKSVVFASDRDVLDLEDTLGDELGVATEQLQWDHLVRLGWSHQGGSTSLAALPVVAGMV